MSVLNLDVCADKRARKEPLSMRSTMTPIRAILHELGLALAMGGTWFGKFHLDPAVKGVSSRPERGHVVATAWGSFLVSDGLGLGMSVATWLKERPRFVSKRAPARLRPLVRAKDVLLGASVLSVATNAIASALLAREARGLAIPMESGQTAAPEATPRMARLQYLVVATGYVHLLASAGALAVSRLLPLLGARGLSRRFA
jgi:hypothetical protein